MAEEIVAKYRVDVTEASKNLTDLANTAKKTEDAMAKSAKAATDSFIAGSNGAKRLDAELAKQPKTLAEMEAKLRNLKELLRDDTKIGTEGFKQVTKAIKETESAIDKANGKLEDTKKQGTGLIGTFKSLATAIGITFVVGQIVSFGKEAVELAANVEGIKRAFDRIGNGSMLDGLRAATRGTVTDLVLMRNAVKADNFKIPLDQLATLFQFAQTRARATGENVDYLVDSIILGIGRKSIPILDNLGISAIELKEKLGDTAKSAATIGDVAAAVGKIATESLEKTGREADTTADRLARLATIWNNFKTDSGGAIVDVATRLAQLFELIPEDVQRTNEFVDSLTNKSVLALDKIGKAQLQAVQSAREAFNAAQNTPFDQLKEGEADRLQKELFIQIDLLKVVQETYKTRLEEVRSAKELEAVTTDQLELERQRQELLSESSGPIKNVYYYTEAIKALNEEINAEGTAVEDLMPLIKERALLQVELTKLTTEQATGTALLNQQLSELKKELDSAEIGGAGFWAVLDKIEKKTKELWEASAMTKLADALIPDVESEDANLTAKIAQENALDQEAYLAKKKNREDFDKWLKEQDEKRLQDAIDNDRAQAESDEEMYRKMAAAVHTYGAIAQQINSLISEAARVETEKELMALESALEAGQITREQYDQERRRLLSKQAADEKAARIFAAIISVAAAVADALPSIPLSIIAAALGAAQIAVIASQPIPKFAKGGYVDEKGMFVGKSHKQGGITIEAEGGEFITSKSKAQKYGHIVEAVNKGTIDKLIKDSYVTPAVNAALLNGFNDIGTSAQLNGLTAKLSDHNIIAAMDRNRQATTYGLAMIANEMRTGKRKNRRGYA